MSRLASANSSTFDGSRTANMNVLLMLAVDMVASSPWCQPKQPHQVTSKLRRWCKLVRLRRDRSTRVRVAASTPGGLRLLGTHRGPEERLWPGAQVRSEELQCS